MEQYISSMYWCKKNLVFFQNDCVRKYGISLEDIVLFQYSCVQFTFRD